MKKFFKGARKLLTKGNTVKSWDNLNRALATLRGLWWVITTFFTQD